MYYDEMIIDGVLHSRTTPDGEWIPVPDGKSRLDSPPEPLGDSLQGVLEYLEDVVYSLRHVVDLHPSMPSRIGKILCDAAEMFDPQAKGT